MAFDPNVYAKPARKPFAQRAVDPIVASTTSGLPANAQGAAASIAAAAFNNGSAHQNISAQTASQADAITSSASDEFFALAGKSSTRSSRADLSKARLAVFEDSKKYFRNHTPQGKISQSRQAKTIKVFTVR